MMWRDVGEVVEMSSSQSRESQRDLGKARRGEIRLRRGMVVLDITRIVI